MKLIIRWLITSASLFVAAYLVPGIRVEDQNAWKVFIVMALILGLVNALLRPYSGRDVLASDHPDPGCLYVDHQWRLLPDRSAHC